MKQFSSTSSKSDKIHHHGYDRFYPFFLNQFQQKSCDILEIGMHEEESVILWREYLPDAQIHGIDILKYESKPGVTMHEVDQSNPTQLSEFAAGKTNQFSIILDDGSHVPHHQTLTIEILWNTLKPGGIYIIEDIETSWWGKSEIYGYKFNSTQINLIDYFKNLPSLINREFSSYRSKQNWMKEIDLISYGQNCIILQKCTEYSATKLNRNYRFKDSIQARSWSRQLIGMKQRLFLQIGNKLGLNKEK